LCASLPFLGRFLLVTMPAPVQEPPLSSRDLRFEPLAQIIQVYPPPFTLKRMVCMIGKVPWRFRHVFLYQKGPFRITLLRHVPAFLPILARSLPPPPPKRIAHCDFLTPLCVCSSLVSARRFYALLWCPPPRFVDPSDLFGRSWLQTNHTTGCFVPFSLPVCSGGNPEDGHLNTLLPLSPLGMPCRHRFVLSPTFLRLPMTFAIIWNALRAAIPPGAFRHHFFPPCGFTQRSVFFFLFLWYFYLVKGFLFPASCVFPFSPLSWLFCLFAWLSQRDSMGHRIVLQPEFESQDTGWKSC